MARTLLFCLCLLTPALASPRPRSWRGQDRIINGSPAEISDFPWMVAMEQFAEHFCGGSIISDSWVLTAGHCFEYIGVIGVTIRAASSVRESGGTVLTVINGYYNENYEQTTSDYDVAVLQIAGTFPLGQDVQIIGLVGDGYDPPAGLSVTVTGWGVTATELRARYLQQANFIVVARDECQGMLPADAYKVTQRMVCAGASGRAVCQGDSGGPLVGPDGLQLGIVSWGNPNCDSFAAVYSSVGSLRSWIQGKTGV